MKTVFRDAQEVCHVWAHQQKSEGRTPGRGNCYFNGDTVYSYGSHFPMGKIVTRKGKTAALITTYGYSNTTAKHIGYARRATSHMTQFFVPLMRDSHGGGLLTARENFDSYQPRVLAAMTRAGKARLNREEYIREAEALVKEANRFAEFFGIKARLSMPANIEAAVEAAKAADAAARKREAAKLTRERKAREAREAAALAEALAKLEEWRVGKIDYVPNNHILPNAALRISNDGKNVETTMSAEVPIEHAERAYRIILRYRHRQQAFHANGTTIRVGHYEVDSVDDAGEVKVGCHRFPWLEVERLAIAAGWGDVEAPADAV